MQRHPTHRKDSIPGLLALAALALGVCVRAQAADEPTEPKKSSAIAIAELKRTDPVDFGKDILPIFRQNCIACHNAKDHEGELILETPQAVRKGGETGPAVVAGKSGESVLLKSAARLDKPFMPPKNNKAGANPLTPDELGLIKLWIDQGAKGEGTPQTGAPIQWHPLPEGLNPIYAVSVTQDGQLAACNRANQIFVYSLPRRELLTRLTDPALVESVGQGRPGVAHRDLVQSLAFSPDGKLLASGGYREVKIWQRPDPATRFSLPPLANKRVGSLATTRDGKLLAVGSDDGVIHLFNLPEGKPRSELKGHSGEVTSLKFSDDGAKLFSGSADKSVRVWNVADGALVSRLDTSQPVSAVLPLGDQILSAGGDNSIRLWSIPTAARNVEGEIPGPITALATSPDRKRVAVAGADRAVRIIDVATAKPAAPMPAMAAPIRAIGFDTTGDQLISASEDGKFVISNLKSQISVEFSDPSGKLTAAALRPDAKQAAVATGDGRVTLWQLDAPAPRALGPADESAATVGAVSLDNKLLATASMVGGKPVVLVRKIESGEIVQKLVGAEGAITAVAFTPDSARVVAGSADKSARVWTLADGKEIARFAGHAGAVTAIAVHSDNLRVVTAAADGSVKIWTLADAKELRSIPGHKGAVVGVAILPKDQLVTASADQSLSVFDLNTGVPVRSTPLGSPATALAVSRDGVKLAIATADKSTRLINAADGATLKTISASVPASALAFSADGKRLVAIGEKLTTVYSSDDATILESFAGPAAFTFASFAEKSDELLVASGDKTVRATPLRFSAATPAFPKKITRLLYAKDGSLLIATSEDGTVRAFASADGAAKYSANHGAPVRDLALSSDGAFLASAGDDKLVKLWVAATGAATSKPQLGPMAAAVTSVAFSTDSRRVIAASATAEDVQVFDREQGTAMESYAGHAQPVVALAALDAPKEGGDVILSASADKSIRIFHTSLRGQFQGHAGVVASLAAIPGDATRFLSGGADGTIRQWVVNSANPEKQFAFGAPVASVVMRADKNFLAAAGGTFAKVFDVKSGQMTATLHGDRGAIDSAQLAERESNLAAFEGAIAKQQADAAVAQQTADTAAVAAATAGKTAADKALVDKQTAATAKLAARDVAAKALADAQAAVAAAAEAQGAIEKQIAVAKASADAAGAKVAELMASSQKLAADAQALAPAVQQAKSKVDTTAGDAVAKAKAATDAKSAADSATADSATAEKAAAEAKVAAEKDPTNKALQDAAAAAVKVAADAVAKSKEAAAALAAAQKPADESRAAAAVASQAYATAQKSADDAANAAKLASLLLESTRTLATGSTAAVQKATEAKTAAGQALVAAKAKVTESEPKAKQAATEAEQADKEVIAARAGITTAEQAIIAAKDAVAKADSALADRKAAQALADAETAKAKVELDNARKTAVASDMPLNCVAFAPDGVTIITGCDDGAIRTFSAEGGGIPCDVIRAHPGAAVSALAVAPDGTILTGSTDRTVKCTDAHPAWSLKATLGTGDDRSPFADRVLALSFSPDGTLLATGGGVPSRSGELKLWSIASGQLFRDIPDAHSDTVFGLSFSGDGKLLASGGADKFARVWNVQTGKLLRAFEGHTHHVLDVSLRYDGRTLVTSGADNAVKVWDVSTGEQRAANAQFSKFEVTSVSHVGFTDRFLVTTGEGLVRLAREADVGVDRSFDVAGANNFLYAGAATPDGTLVLSGGYDSVLRVRDARDGKVVADLSPPDAAK